MHAEEIDNLLQSETRAFRYLVRFCWKNHQRFCPRCRHRKTYKLRDQRRRCARCGYTFHDFSGRWINNGGLACRQWLQIITFFAMDYTVLAMSRELNLAYNTVYKAVTTLRCAIAANANDARTFFSMQQRVFSASRGRMVPSHQDKATTPVPIFGIREHADQATATLLPGIFPKTAFNFHHDPGLQIGQLGKIFFTSPYQEYDALLFCTHVPPPCPINPTMNLGKPASVKGSFVRFALEHTRRCKGLSPERFPLYIKELEFRFNNRTRVLLPLIAELACGFVPNLE
ncbi:MAG TPA: DDE transposase [Desulfonatronum sp.]|nr:DDE transposase [Desulfonatronum sp.]